MQNYCIVTFVTGVYYINVDGSDVCPDLDYRHLLHHHSNSSLAEVFIHSNLSEK